MTKCEYYLHFFGYAKKEDSDSSTDSSRSNKAESQFNSFEPTVLDFYDYKGQASKES